jgi:MOSC domain-containing protein YiiM
LTASALNRAIDEAKVSFVSNWGVVEALVLRSSTGERQQPTRATLTVDGGLDGDRWAGGKALRGEQISVMNLDVAEAIANGQSIVLFGDNVFTRLDLGALCLTVGTRLWLGGALTEVSAVPHTPCTQFRERFGEAAFECVAKTQRLRGIYLTVIGGGEVAVGDRFVRA